MRHFKVVFLLLLGGCQLTSSDNKKPTAFTLLDSEETGVTFANDLTDQGDLNIIEYLYYYNGGGVASGDLDNDGLPELFFTGNQVPNRLYKNNGSFQFQDISDHSGTSQHTGWATGVTMADINADGWLDIFVCQVSQLPGMEGHNLLYLNNGDLTFTEASAQWGLDFKGYSTQAAFFDYDLDGDLDMYLLNHAVHTTRSYRSADTRDEFDPLSGDRLFQSQLAQGDSSFKDLSNESGIYSSAQGYGLGLVISDINEDGWPDIYVGNDFHENDYLYLNNQDGTFTESLTKMIPHTTRFTMGVDIRDINGDIHPDIFQLDMLPENHRILMKSGGEDDNKVTEIKLNYGYHHQLARNNFQLNRGDNTFSDVALLTETYATDWSWSTLIADYDLDGQNEIFITNGIYKRPNDLDYINYLSNINLSLFSEKQQDSVERELIKRMPTIQLSNFMFDPTSLDSLKYTNKSADWGLDKRSYSHGATYADFDGDGDLDLAVNNTNQPAFVYENKIGDSTNHFIAFSLKENSFNKSGIGARVRVFAGDKQWQQENFTTRGFQSAVTSNLTFGLGDAPIVDSVHVIWPDRTYQVVMPDVVDSVYVIEKSENTRPYTFSQSASVSNLTTLDFKHQEDHFKDYDQELLIPQKLSTEGPALATGDVNNDGWPDLYIGGAHGQRAALYLGSEDGFVNKIKGSGLEQDFIYEDVDAVFFDADQDGDLDLFVVSGGGRFPEGSIQLSDRFYTNDGKGHFTRELFNSPYLNGSCVAVGDVNGDQLPDLFIGGRSVPGSYGVDPVSYVLTNTGKGQFVIGWQQRLGMVTDAEFSDLDRDGDLELLVVGDWMSLTVLDNDEGNFTDVSDIWGTTNTNGWWNSIYANDIDGDGDTDFVLGNLGLNSKLKASVDEPLNLYLADWDGNRQVDPIIFYYKNGVSIPLMPKDKLIAQMPILKKKFLSYNEFAKVDEISDLFDTQPGDFQVKKITELRSCVFLNQGDSLLKIPLPLEAQFSPVQSAVFADWDNDGNDELILGGNFYGSVSQIGRYDASSGVILKSLGEGNFTFDQWLDVANQLEVRELTYINNQLIIVPNNDAALILTK